MTPRPADIDADFDIDAFPAPPLVARVVTASDRAEVVAADPARTAPTLRRYLGADQDRWDPRFAAYLERPDAAVFHLVAEHLVARDPSFQPSRR
ncbi:MAG TPA: hypothetical protein VNT56_09435 [Acidimicrobiales bacterium]|nr:hypothetical protein [Acidimicrobiales bacterium]